MNLRRELEIQERGRQALERNRDRLDPDRRKGVLAAQGARVKRAARAYEEQGGRAKDVLAELRTDAAFRHQAAER